MPILTNPGEVLWRQLSSQKSRASDWLTYVGRPNKKWKWIWLPEQVFPVIFFCS